MMKKIAFSACMLLSLLACKKIENFLDKPPGVDVDENVVFSSRQNLDLYIATMYQYGVPSIFPIRAAETGFGANAFASTGGEPSGITTILSGITDESEASESFAATQNWNTGAIQPTNILRGEDGRYFLRWQAIRVANIILERINEVPNLSTTYRDEVRGEALFIRALNNFDMLKRYGGIPLVMKRLVTLEESKIPRSTFEATVNAIVKDCDEAIALLPFTQPSGFVGRAHDGAARALKARTLLYAASPLFNTATPYLSLGGADDKLICYGNYDLNRWRLAATANKDVLDWARDNGCALIDVPNNRRSLNKNSPGLPISGNYRTQWEQPDNAEVIFSCKIWGGPKAISNFPYQGFIPRNDYVANAGGFWVGTSPTFNFVRTYEDTLGNNVPWDPAGGNDLLAKYASLDFRFCQTVAPVGSRLHASVTRLQIWEGSVSNRNTCRGGHWLLKGIPDALPNAAQIPNVPVFRLNEFYLNYAECLNELGEAGAPSVIITPAQRLNYILTGSYPAVPTGAYDQVNKVRLRSAMPPIPLGLSQSQLREYIRKERFLELAFEEHRLWDVRRWMIAEQDGILNGGMTGLEITRLNMATPFPTAFSYRPFVFETRVFAKKNYLHPFDQNEILKGTLKQNPGW